MWATDGRIPVNLFDKACSANTCVMKFTWSPQKRPALNYRWSTNNRVFGISCRWQGLASIKITFHINTLALSQCRHKMLSMPLIPAVCCPKPNINFASKYSCSLINPCHQLCLFIFSHSLVQW